MDAPIRRRLLAACLATACGGAGCGMLGHEADQKADDTFADPKLHVPVHRAQSPDGPRAPAVLPAAERPGLPVPARPAAPVVPLDAAVTPVGAAEVTPVAEKSSSAVRPIATVGTDNFISDEEVSMMMKQRARDYVMLKGEEREKKEKEVYKEELKKLIDRELILTEFLGRVKKNNPGAADDLWEQARKSADAHFREMRKAFNIKTEADFLAELDKQGMPPKLFRRQIERQTLMNMFLNTVLKDKSGTPTLAQVQDFYARNTGEFKVDDRVKYQHLFVSSGKFGSGEEAKRKAEELFNKARAGTEFAALAKDAGDGVLLLQDGTGDAVKRGEIPSPLVDKAIWDIKAGNFSGVIPSENGFHVLKVIERDVAGTRPLDEKMQTEIRNKLADQAMKAERDKLTAQLWRQIGVTIVEKR
jgi:peptidyl-prolyl cis-trans isomerase SurA